MLTYIKLYFHKVGFYLATAYNCSRNYSLIPAMNHSDTAHVSPIKMMMLRKFVNNDVADTDVTASSYIN